MMVPGVTEEEVLDVVEMLGGEAEWGEIFGKLWGEYTEPQIDTALNNLIEDGHLVKEDVDEVPTYSLKD